MSGKYKFILTALCVIMMMITGCGGNSMAAKNTGGTQSGVTDLKGKKILVAYYSWGGTTSKVAEQIHAQVGGDLFEIKTVQQYPAVHKDATAIAEKEMKSQARPALSTSVANMAQYDVIILGYPIWWHTAPMAVNTFLESYDLTGKIILPFCTSGGDSVDRSVEDMRKLVGNKAKVLDGVRANLAEETQSWLNKNGLKEKGA